MAKVIMVQGTMSSAGKSFLVAGLCRIFKQDGYKVAPFKSQNMALNSYITEDGLEMGRAQVMQAEAAGIKPSVLMNPILLKPTTDVGSQVIVYGEVRGNMKAMEYFGYKKTLIPEVKKAFEMLSEEYDIIVIEGAGSPAEINLKQEDIVNMGMAKLADAPVLLAGDIDRGGVFAQLIGTVMLLEEEEKKRIKGLIINKFRGDRAILEPGIKMLEEKAAIPVVGVIPYVFVDIDDEDSLSERLTKKTEVAAVDIAVIQFPRISNFTDFNRLSAIPEVSLRYVSSVAELKNPDLILLPGTKSTIEDLLWMRQNGLETVICKAAAAGTLIFGVCGGYQMLGKLLSDPDGVEGEPMREIRGLSLLPVQTVFKDSKVRTLVKGVFSNFSGDYAALSGLPMEGYEIHMGETILEEGVQNCTTLLEEQNASCLIKKEDGACYQNICGTYVHGIFDKEEALKGIMRLLFQRKGLNEANLPDFSYADYKEEQYNRLADAMRANLDLNCIYEMMGVKKQ